MLRCILGTLSAILISELTFSQVSIKNISASFNGTETEITYDLISDSKQQFFVNLRVSNNITGKYNTRTISGDVGTGVTPGKSKTIYWNQLSDGYTIDGYVTVTIELIPQKKLRAGAAITKSLFVPGLGDYQLRPKKHYFVYTLGIFGAVGTGGYFYNQSNRTYDRYLASTEIQANDRHFRQANTERYISYGLFGAAVLGWAADLIALKVRANKLKRQSQYVDGSYYLPPNAKAKPAATVSSAPLYLNTKTKFDIASENGDKAFARGNYQKAKEEFEKAQKLKPGDKSIGAKLSSIEEALEEIRLNDEQYEKILNEGMALIKSKKYISARNKLDEAIALKPSDDSAARAGIAEIDDIEESNRKAKEYNQLVADARSDYNRKEHEKASEKLDRALSLYPKGKDALSLKERVAAAIDRIVSEKYRKKISQAEIALENREYSRAKMLFEDASALKPKEEYPKKRIESINAIINEVSTESLPELFKRCKGAVFYVIFPGKEGVSGGSGFFISEDGIAVSNYHVFKGKSKGSEIILTEDESEYSVSEVLDKNEELDYIIFRVRKKNSFEKFPTVPLANKVPVIGQRLFAIGNPNFLEKTLSDGIVSGFRGDRDEYIQITVPITHGSSGGPLFNMDGEVVGITTSGYGEGSLNFAVDIQKLRLYRFKGKSTGTW